MTVLAVGMRVKTKRKYRGAHHIGVVAHINGAYVYVRLDAGFDIEAYDVELEVLDATD